MIPSYGISLVENPDLFRKLHAETAEVLGLNEVKEEAKELEEVK